MPLQATSGAASYDAFGGGVAAVPNYIEDVFSTYLYTGNGSTQTITNGIDLAGKGGLVWVKCRSLSSNQTWSSTDMGATNYLTSDTTGSLTTNANALTAFNSNGFSVGSLGNFNSNTAQFVSWAFRKQRKFFTCLTYTGNGIAGRQIPHDLGSVPGCIIVKSSSNTGTFWTVYHRSMPNTDYLRLNTTAAQATNSRYWNSTTPTDTVFTVGDSGEVNVNGWTYSAFLFAHDAGGFGLTGTDNVISCGSITLDGSNYTTVDLGYEPQWVLIKNATTTSSSAWEICDNMRGMPATSGENYLLANSSAAEGTGGYNLVRPTSTGFSANSSAGTYIYIAIRRGPMKVPTSGTSVFSPVLTTTNDTITTNFPVDLSIFRAERATTSSTLVFDRLRGNQARLVTSTTGAETTSSSYPLFDNNTGTALTGFTAGQSGVDWAFRRAPSFFDEVCYTGSFAGPRQFSHNLVAVPEIMIVKTRTGPSGWNWIVYHKDLGNTSYIALNSTAAKVTSDTSVWTSTTPTSTIFSVGPSGSGNYAPTNADSYTYVNYLFATCAGVSKVGSYTGTEATQQVNCGFTGGARFVLIKRTDSVGDWYVWDSARGIVSGNDPYVLWNSSIAEVTNTDYVDTYSAGFEISNTAPAALNGIGGTFIFLAIA